MKNDNLGKVEMMMKIFFLLLSVLLSVSAEAVFNPTSCWSDQNAKVMATIRSAGKKDPLYLDESGNIVVMDPTRIASRTTQNGVDTLVVKATDSSGKEVRRTLVITKRQGQIVSVKADQDLQWQQNQQDLFHSLGKKVDLVKSQQADYTYDRDNNCAINQQIISTSAKANSKESQKVIYDKAFCDKVEPVMSEMGESAISKCSQFFLYAQKAYDARSADLKKEGKTMNALGGENPGIANYNGVLNLGQALQWCTNFRVPVAAMEQMDSFTLRVRNTFQDLPSPPTNVKSGKGTR